MEYSEIIYLLTNNLEEDEIGNIISSSQTQNKCYAKKQSVRSSDFYKAVEIGLRPRIEFVVKRLNYNDEDSLIWNGEVYSIIKTSDPKNKFDIVLICEKKISDVHLGGSI